MEAIISLIGLVIALTIILVPIGVIALSTVILIKKLKKPQNNHNNEYYNKINYPKQNKNNSYNTGWKWNESTGLWEPPNYVKRVESSEPKPADINFRTAYQARPIFTRNEWQNYKKLRDIADVKGYVICPKVRLLDIIEPRKDQKKYKTLYYKVQAKHVDFVVCDTDMYIKAIIELDDKSHNRKDRQERDKFVDTILQSVGYKVIHTQYINNDILDLV